MSASNDADCLLQLFVLLVLDYVYYTAFRSQSYLALSSFPFFSHHCFRGYEEIDMKAMLRVFRTRNKYIFGTMRTKIYEEN